MMNLSSLSFIRQLCIDNGISPQKHRGQNFLVDKNVLDKMLRLAEVKKTDTILEIGPGFGVLTEALARQAKKVVAVELDKKIFPILKNTFRGHKNIILVNEDILKFRVTSYKFQDLGYRLIANLPYSITSAVLQKFLTDEPRPKDIIILIQWDVAERILAKPGEMSLLAISVQLYGQPEILMKVRPGSFWPKPGVESALLKIEVGERHGGSKEDFDDRLFWQVVKAGFRAKRKQLVNNLSRNLEISKETAVKWIIAAGLDPKIRAEGLSVEDWLRLAKITPIKA
ncbi:MAG: 16S rRNA (adenine(1518)-N(6)/adenine(1519)-N(6))-dimethyltransferase RsmA [Patescibacteria group bacterium]|nr:16S rRNA (adenine(1518)-N(6)/adenine(1519)-N(6))-dimethyltransferase RsmA [Patescibacteria group bacterium]MDD5490257.1 16S rRNA (adenine(1518)-N(6)/adenine(1519)-N(6))-dimethyltransferase RsmA [Patescibacteria group bacterium]